ncbi:MAG: hypothetical protein ACTSR8_00900 [Promethearchaeota archaeon]
MGLFDKDDVGRAPIDYFSWGHVAMGLATFLLISLINTIPSWVVQDLVYIIPYWSMLVLSFVVAIIWEILENTVLLEMGFKFEGRRDSLINAIFDILFVCIGALIIWIIKGIMVNLNGVHLIPAYYIVGVISFAVVIIAFLIAKAMTK